MNLGFSNLIIFHSVRKQCNYICVNIFEYNLVYTAFILLYIEQIKVCIFYQLFILSQMVKMKTLILLLHILTYADLLLLFSGWLLYLLSVEAFSTCSVQRPRSFWKYKSPNVFMFTAKKKDGMYGWVRVRVRVMHASDRWIDVAFEVGSILESIH